MIDIDASLVEVHSENKEGTAAHYKGGFGFHPMYAFADCTGECLAVQLRPGNAAANSITDQTAVLDASIEALPTDAACGHRLGDDASQARRRVRVRADSAGCNGFIAACVERNVGYSVVARRTPEVEAAIATAVTQPALWQPAEPQPRPNNQRGQSHRRRQSRRRGARAADLTRFVDREHRPEPDARLIMRREPLHQGAQRSLFPSDDWRYWGHWTNLEGSPAARDADMRAHARVEDHIARLKDSGAKRFPFCDLAANAAWHQLAALADTVVRWFQQTCLTGALKHARPQNTAMEPLAHPRPPRAPRPSQHPHTAREPRRHRGHTQRPHPHRPAHLSTHPHRRGRPQHRAGPTRPSAPRHRPPSPKTPHQAHTAPPTTPHTPGPPPLHTRQPPQNTRKHTHPAHSTILMHDQG